MYRVSETIRGKLKTSATAAELIQGGIVFPKSSVGFDLSVLYFLTYTHMDSMKIGEWTNKDNENASRRGWMFVHDPGKPAELISLTRGTTPYEIYETVIEPNKNNGGLESRAYAVLCGMKLLYPEHRFLYEKSAKELRSGITGGGPV